MPHGGQRVYSSFAASEYGFVHSFSSKTAKSYEPDRILMDVVMGICWAKGRERQYGAVVNNVSTFDGSAVES